MIPTEQEMREAGVRLGLLEEGQAVPPRLRSKLAKVVQAAESETAADRQAVDRSSKFADDILDLWSQLDGIPQEPRGQIVAALAPTIWRTTEGATQ